MKRKCGFRWQIYHQEELKIHLNLSWFKLYTISPKKWQFILVDTYSPWKDTAAILNGYLGLSTRLKTSSLDFPFSWHVFFIGFNKNTISFLFSCPSCDFHQNNGKNQGIDIFKHRAPTMVHHNCYIIKSTCFSHWFQ